MYLSLWNPNPYWYLESEKGTSFRRSLPASSIIGTAFSRGCKYNVYSPNGYWECKVKYCSRQQCSFNFNLLITMPAKYIKTYDMRKKRSLIPRHLNRYLTIRCHGNNVTLFIFEDSFLLYLLLRKGKAPLDANEATQFTNTALTVLPAHFKQHSTSSLREKWTQIQLISSK